jgi:hypothetical protein
MILAHLADVKPLDKTGSLRDKITTTAAFGHQLCDLFKLFSIGKTSTDSVGSFLHGLVALLHDSGVIG